MAVEKEPEREENRSGLTSFANAAHCDALSSRADLLFGTTDESQVKAWQPATLQPAKQLDARSVLKVLRACDWPLAKCLVTFTAMKSEQCACPVQEWSLWGNV